MKPTEEIESEVAALESRRAQLIALREAAVADAAAAETNLEKFLDESDLANGLNGAQILVNTARQNVVDLDHAVERQVGLIATARAALADARDRDTREQAAIAREGGADQVEDAAIELQAAVRSVA